MPDPPAKTHALADAFRDAEANFADNEIGHVVDVCPTDIMVDFAPLPGSHVAPIPSPFLVRESGGISVVVSFSQAPNQSVGKRVGGNPLLYQAYAPCKAGVVIEIHITVPPLVKGGVPALEIWQAFRVERDNLMTPIGATDSKTTTRYTRHPRVRGIEPRSGNLPRVRVDITFIEVTDVVRQRPGRPLSQYDEPWYDIDFQSGEPTARAMHGRPDPKGFHHDCELHVYEMTMGKPRAWAIVVPKAARKGSPCNVLVFFQPTLYNAVDYTDTLDCPGYISPHLPRYTRDPQAEGPFYFQTRPAQTQEMLQFYQTGNWNAAALPTNAALDQMGARYYRMPYPNTGFEGQLAASGKAVVLAMPFPHGGGMEYAAASNQGLAELVGSLARALAADGGLSDEKAGIERISLGRVGVSGFSAGGGAAIGAYGSNQKLVRELYVFDHFSGLGAETFSPWLADSDTRLCLIGGQGVSAAIALKAKLSFSNVFLTPDDPSFFNAPGNTWEAALFPPVSAGAWESGPRSLSDSGAGGTSSYSATSNVYVTQTSRPLTLGIPGVASHAIAVSRVESASLVRMWQLVNAESKGHEGQTPTKQAPFSYERASTSKDLDDLTTADVLLHYGIGQNAVGDMRHQWAVQGGIGAASRFPYGPQDPKSPDGTAFEGYLHFCLKHSAFP